MLSRVADSLYWMSRYMERSDGILRMLRVNYASSQDDAHDFSWKPVLSLFTYLDEAAAKELGKSTRGVLQYIVTEKENPNSILNIVTKARENARSVQDHITKELWQCLNDYYHTVKDSSMALGLRREDPVTILDVLIRQGMLYYGTTDITMARGEGYSYMNIGKFLERAIQSTDILDVKFSDRHHNNTNELRGSDTTYWKYLLLSLSGYELYLKTYRSGFEAGNVVEQIMLNTNFPRSVIYSINQLHRYFERLKSERNAESYQKVEFFIGKLKSRIRYSTAGMLMQPNLHANLLSIKEDLFNIANAFNQYYFAYS